MGREAQQDGLKRPAAPVIRFKATLQVPASGGRGGWTFVVLPRAASAKLRTRGQAAVAGTLNGVAFEAMLDPDGSGSHWLKVSRKLRLAAGAAPGDEVSFELERTPNTPEPAVPPDLRKALAAAPAARAVWSDITPAARHDWILWITSAKRQETRASRIAGACDMLAMGKRRVCCFDRSGLYSGALKAPDARPPRRGGP